MSSGMGKEPFVQLGGYSHCDVAYLMFAPDITADCEGTWHPVAPQAVVQDSPRREITHPSGARVGHPVALQQHSRRIRLSMSEQLAGTTVDT
jgi:hypothetical protein